MAKETKVVELDEMVVSIEKSVPKKVDGKTRYNVMVNFNPRKVVLFEGKKYLIKNPKKNKFWTLAVSRATKRSALLVYEEI